MPRRLLSGSVLAGFAVAPLALTGCDTIYYKTMK
jgi:hypothetical protein